MAKLACAFMTFMSALLLADYVSAAAVMTPPSKDFFCQYYSDGTNTCYLDSRSKAASDSAKDERVDQAFDFVGVGKPVHGTWVNADGLFTLPAAKGARKYLGTCIFSTDSTWQCSGPPSITTNADGSMSGTGGSLFHGSGYKGVPGGRIQAV